MLEAANANLWRARAIQFRRLTRVPIQNGVWIEIKGTYSHSIIVGNLSEAAAEAIGADGLFCRVASYYHDVGKVMRPHFFVENQIGENRHNSINPSLSSLVGRKSRSVRRW